MLHCPSTKIKGDSLLCNEKNFFCKISFIYILNALGPRAPSEEFGFHDVTRSPSNERVASKTDVRTSQESMADTPNKANTSELQLLNFKSVPMGIMTNRTQII